MTVTHPIADDDVDGDLRPTRPSTSRGYQADWMPWIADMHSRVAPAHDRPAGDAARRGGSRCWRWHRRCAPASVTAACCAPAISAIAHRLPAGEVRAFAGEPYGFRFDIQRELVETVVAERAVDWSNALFLSCRFRAWRAGPFNEYLYNFFKSLSAERMRRAEAEARRKLDPDRGELAGEEIRIGDYIVERACPHRQADLSVFGEIDDGELVCTLHGWRFDLDTGAASPPTTGTLKIRRGRRPERAARSHGQLCTQTVVRSGMRFWSQIKSIAAVLRRTQPCDAGWFGTLVMPWTAMPPTKYFGR